MSTISVVFTPSKTTVAIVYSSLWFALTTSSHDTQFLFFQPDVKSLKRQASPIKTPSTSDSGSLSVNTPTSAKSGLLQPSSTSALIHLTTSKTTTSRGRHPAFTKSNPVSPVKSPSKRRTSRVPKPSSTTAVGAAVAVGFEDLELTSPEKKSASALGVALRNLLKLPKAHKWVCFEFFYSNIDK